MTAEFPAGSIPIRQSAGGSVSDGDDGRASM